MSCPACTFDSEGYDVQALDRIQSIVIDGESRRLPQRQFELAQHIADGYPWPVNKVRIASEMFPNLSDDDARTKIVIQILKLGESMEGMAMVPTYDRVAIFFRRPEKDSDDRYTASRIEKRPVKEAA